MIALGSHHCTTGFCVGFGGGQSDANWTGYFPVDDIVLLGPVEQTRGDTVLIFGPDNGHERTF